MEFMLLLTVQSCLGVFVVRWLVQRCDDGGHSSKSVDVERLAAFSVPLNWATYFLTCTRRRVSSLLTPTMAIQKEVRFLPTVGTFCSLTKWSGPYL